MARNDVTQLILAGSYLPFRSPLVQGGGSSFAVHLLPDHHPWKRGFRGPSVGPSSPWFTVRGGPNKEGRRSFVGREAFRTGACFYSCEVAMNFPLLEQKRARFRSLSSPRAPLVIGGARGYGSTDRQESV